MLVLKPFIIRLKVVNSMLFFLDASPFSYPVKEIIGITIDHYITHHSVVY